MNVTKDNEVWVAVGRYDNFPEHSGKTIRFQTQEVALFRLSDGRLKAIENRCPHKNGVLAEGIVCDGHVFCPMHDRKIDLSSGLVQAPDTGCVQTYDVTVENGMVYIAFKAEKHVG